MSIDGITARPDYRLSKRQMQVLWLMACGYNNTEIGAQLGLSLNWVGECTHRIYQTMGVQDRVQAIIYALMHNLVHVEDAYADLAQRLKGIPTP